MNNTYTKPDQNWMQVNANIFKYEWSWFRSAITNPRGQGGCGDMG
jgi:hypothetical protein